MTQKNNNIETPPAVETPEYEAPPKPEQRAWNWGTTTIIAAVFVVFVVIILIYVLTR
jgi:hypothetical protein